MLKSREPSIDPCGTAEMIFFHIIMEYPLETGLKLKVLPTFNNTLSSE